jgi:hypothetical protein
VVSEGKAEVRHSRKALQFVTRMLRVLHFQSQQASDPNPKHLAGTLHRGVARLGREHSRVACVDRREVQRLLESSK